MNNILVFDTETTGLAPKGAHWGKDFVKFPHIVQISWSFNGEMKDYIIYPDGYEIPQESTDVHGISTEKAIAEGVPLSGVIDEFMVDCNMAEWLVGHNVYFDVSTIKANAIRLYGTKIIGMMNIALDKTKRIDTMYKTIKFCDKWQVKNPKMRKFPTLVELYEKLFDETFPAHNSADDVRATERCFYKLLELKTITVPGFVYGLDFATGNDRTVNMDVEVNSKGYPVFDHMKEVMEEPKAVNSEATDRINKLRDNILNNDIEIKKDNNELLDEIKSYLWDAKESDEFLKDKNDAFEYLLIPLMESKSATGRFIDGKKVSDNMSGMLDKFEEDLKKNEAKYSSDETSDTDHAE